MPRHLYTGRFHGLMFAAPQDRPHVGWIESSDGRCMSVFLGWAVEVDSTL